jgi:hypothetical protein
MELQFEPELRLIQAELSMVLGPINAEIADLTDRIRLAPAGDPHSADGRRNLSRIRRYNGWLARMKEAYSRTVALFEARERDLRERLRQERDKLVADRLGLLP